MKQSLLHARLMVSITRIVLGCLAAVCAVPLGANAAITVLNHYRLGENDPGAINGGTFTTMKDSAGGVDLTVDGTPLWTNDVSAPVAQFSAGLLSARVDGMQYGYANLLNT